MSLIQSIFRAAPTIVGVPTDFEDAVFTSSGKEIRVAVCKPRSADPSPAILVLHGAAGGDVATSYVRQIASVVAAGGFATFLVEYFDRTGTRYADDRTIFACADQWVATIFDAVDFVTERPDVDPLRLGAFGYSLGGFLAISHSSRDPRVRAVVELAGGIDPFTIKTVKRLPPTLIIHGEADRRVPFAHATALEDVLRRLGTPVETEYFPGESHVLSPAAAYRALSRTLRFYGRHLRGEPANRLRFS